MLPLRKLGKVYIESLCEPPGKPCYFRVCVCVCVCRIVSNSVTPWTVALQALRKNTRFSIIIENTEVGCHSLLQGLFLVTACKSTVTSNFH